MLLDESLPRICSRSARIKKKANSPAKTCLETERPDPALAGLFVNCYLLAADFLRLRQLCRLHDHIASAGATIHELDYAAHLGEERVVLAAADVGAGLDARAALANDDG